MTCISIHSLKTNVFTLQQRWPSLSFACVARLSFCFLFNIVPFARIVDMHASYVQTQLFQRSGRRRTSANMCQRNIILLALACSVAFADATLSAGSRANAGGAQYTLNLHPPTEDSSSVQTSLDVIMSAENTKRRRADDEFANAKQSMLDAEKRKIHDIITSAFAGHDSSF